MVIVIHHRSHCHDPARPGSLTPGIAGSVRYSTKHFKWVVTPGGRFPYAVTSAWSNAFFAAFQKQTSKKQLDACCDSLTYLEKARPGRCNGHLARVEFYFSTCLRTAVQNGMGIEVVDASSFQDSCFALAFPTQKLVVSDLAMLNPLEILVVMLLLVLTTLV